jgi:hypothetical protein
VSGQKAPITISEQPTPTGKTQWRIPLQHSTTYDVHMTQKMIFNI